jgi:hypothetical protein
MSRTSLVMVDNLAFLGQPNPFAFRFVLPEPLRRVGEARLLSMTMDYSHCAVHVGIDELALNMPVFVDKALDAPLLLAPHVVYERKFKGSPLDLLSTLTINVTTIDGEPPDASHAQKTRVTMLFAFEHDCAEVLADDGMRRHWLLVSNTHAADPYAFEWTATAPLHDVRRVAVKALVISMHAASGAPYVRLAIPSLGIREWPIPFTSDAIGTFHPFVLMHRDPAYQVEFRPPMATLASIDPMITHGTTGLPVAWQAEGFERSQQLVLMLLEVDTAPCTALIEPAPVLDRLLFIDNATPASFRFVLDEPCRNVARLTLRQLACPHARMFEGSSTPAPTCVRLTLSNLGICWTVPYSIWIYRPQTNVANVMPSIHTAVFATPIAFTHLDVVVEIFDGVSGSFVPLVPEAEASPVLCFTLLATFAAPKI